jgi:hypothetical protein
MALDKLKHQYTEPLQVSALNVDSNISTTSLTIGGVPISSSYLTISTAASTYLTISNAASTYGSLIASNTFTAANTIAPTSTSVIPLTINAPSGVSVDVLDVDINGTKYLWVDKFGNTFNGSLTVGTATALGARLGLYTNGPTVVGEIIKCAPLQTSDLLQTQNSSGTILSGINAAGQIYAGTTGSIVGSVTAGITVSSYTATTATYVSPSSVSLNIFSAGQTVTITGFSPSTYNGTFVIQSVGGSVNAWTFTVANTNNVPVTTNTGTFSLSPQGAFTSANAYTIPLVAKAGSSSQVSYLQEWQDSTGTVLAKVDYQGNLTAKSYQSIDANGYGQDIDLMTLMGAWV